MERLGQVVARVLANVRVTMDERKAGAGVEPAPEVSARERVNAGRKRALGELDHPRTAIRRSAKMTTTNNAARETT